MSNPSSAIVGQGLKFAAKVAVTASITFAVSAPQISRATGSFITDGFVVGMVVTTNDGANPGPFTVTAVSATGLTVTGTVTAVAAASKTVTGKALVGEITSFQGPGGAANVIDVTTLESTAKEKRMGLPDEGQFQIDFNCVFGDVGQKYLRDKRVALAKVEFEIIFTDATPTIASFAGFVLEFSISGAVDDKVAGSATIEITGPVTYA
jgi:hypothetical protein